MTWLFDGLYALGLLILSPWLLVRACVTGRYRQRLRAKLFGTPALPIPAQAPVWFHGVSVGEIHLLATLVSAFRVRHPGRACVISSTTDTGFAEASKRFTDLPVIVWPFDFSWAIRRTLDAVQPRMVVLAESELWPNFLRICQQRGIPVVVVNGRMSPRSFRRYGWIAGLSRWLLLGRITHFALQSSDYAERLTKLGIPASRISVTGSIKYDGAPLDRNNAKTRELRRQFGLAEHHRVWVAGSAHAPEEQCVIDAFVQLRQRDSRLRLILVPRSPDRFEEVAKLVERAKLRMVRRSQMTGVVTGDPEVFLIDTIGELSAVWGLADIGFVGGTLDGQRGGQSMIEPAAYGVPVIMGPHVWNFRDAVTRLLEVDAAVKLRDASELQAAVRQLLDDPLRRERMGTAAAQLVRQQQGATKRTLDLLDRMMPAITEPKRESR